jgi:hypothetical protein
MPMLALRCRVSHPLEAWLRVTHSKYRETYCLGLLAMASQALDDTGSLTFRTAPAQFAAQRTCPDYCLQE